MPSSTELALTYQTYISRVAPGLTASGSDAARTVRAELQAVSAQPGANRFVVRVEDYRSRKPVRGAQVQLRFTPLDDPGVRPTSLALASNRNGGYVGSGGNLAFDGRWRATAVVNRSAGSVEVPLELDVRGPKQFISVRRAPGQAPEYTAQVGKFGSLGYIEMSPHPERAGPSRVYVTCLDNIESELTVEHLVVTGAAGDGAARQQPVRRLGPGRFVADLNLQAGRFTIAVVARAQGGARLRSVFALHVPRG